MQEQDRRRARSGPRGAAAAPAAADLGLAAGPQRGRAAGGVRERPRDETAAGRCGSGPPIKGPARAAAASREWLWAASGWGWLRRGWLWRCAHRRTGPDGGSLMVAATAALEPHPRRLPLTRARSLVVHRPKCRPATQERQLLRLAAGRVLTRRQLCAVARSPDSPPPFPFLHRGPLSLLCLRQAALCTTAQPDPPPPLLHRLGRVAACTNARLGLAGAKRMH